MSDNRGEIFLRLALEGIRFPVNSNGGLTHALSRTGGAKRNPIRDPAQEVAKRPTFRAVVMSR
ncbi:hypothetical protein [Methylobacterium iners]|uniref:Uncharacterized protein n=1 Tax=Methylobacterium iners TaxID=418707 RepID=A0ABQ4RVV6_9HYPH|nr:hypothetical protein [Methylobacterium iners]GJD94955.1 hypothetical protein OCOJLMKI_2163 [Methylobacterium iners]